MTTLPQTTVRLPRIPTALAPTNGPAASVAHAPSAAAAYAMTANDIWRVMRSNAWLIVTLLILSAVGGFGINSLLKKYCPSYTSQAEVIVSPPRNIDPLKVGEDRMDAGALTFELRRNAQELKIPQYYTEVLSDPASPILDTAWRKQFSTTAAAQKDLVDNLIVTPGLDSPLIKVEISTREKEDGIKIIEAVVDRVIADQSKRNADYQGTRNVELNSMLQSIDLKRAELLDDIQTKETRLNISSVGSGRLNVRESELNDMTKYKLDAEEKSYSAEQALARAQDMMKNNEDPPAVINAVNLDPSVQRYRELVNNAELRMLTQTSLGDSNDTYKQMQSEKGLFAKKLSEAENDVKAAKRIEYLEGLRLERDTAKTTVDRANEQIQAIDAEIESLNKDLEAYQTERDQLLPLDAKRKEVVDQLEQIANYTNQKNQTNLEWNNRPEASEIPTFPKLSVTMGLSIALGLLLSLGIAFSREMMDSTVRSPRDITRVGHMTMLGMISHEDDDPQARGTRLPLVIFETPQSMMAEQLRQVRTRLQHAASLDTTHTILITSPSPDDGKSTIAVNLACGLALNGRRILLVDANFRRPAIHKIFNISNEVGFGDVLNKVDSFATAVQESQVPNLYILPTGVKPANATELLESQLFTDFVERALEEFDHVIFDSGPLLLVSETAALAPRVDGVVTVVRARTNTRGLLQRLRDNLRQIKAEHLGVVLNGVRSQGGGYYGRNIRTFYDYQNGHSD